MPKVPSVLVAMILLSMMTGCALDPPRSAKVVFQPGSFCSGPIAVTDSDGRIVFSLKDGSKINVQPH
jgi:hypothetical protein